MRILRRTSIVLWLLVGFSSLCLGQSKELIGVAQMADKHYDQLKSLRSQFTEIYHGGGMSRTESGTLWLKKPRKMRWEYTEPRKKVFLSDGKTAWFYVPGEQQARRAPVNKLDDIRSPLRFLLGKTKLLKEFDQLEIAQMSKPENPGDVVLRGAPKGMEDRISQVTLEVTPEGRIDRIMIEEADGSTTDFRFRDEVENAPVAEGLFKFSPPAGIEVVEGNELGN